MNETDKVDYPEIRRRVHEALQEIIGEEENESTIVSGWVLIWEGVHEDNKKSLTYVTSEATGEDSLTPWVSRGYMSHIESLLFITDVADEDDEEEE